MREDPIPIDVQTSKRARPWPLTALPIIVASSLVLSCGDQREGPALYPRPADQHCLADPIAPLPTLLSDTGCFEGQGTATPSPELIPYALNAPLWTEGASKTRYLVVPPGAQIGVNADSTLAFPVGSVLVKVFAFGTEAEDVVETRVMVRRPDGWDFGTYRQDAEGLESRLLQDSVWQELVVDGTTLNYFFPGREDCISCHSDAGRVLGPRIAQLNRDYDYDGLRANQLSAMDEIDLFADLPPLEELPSWPSPTGSASVRERARAYLHANCAHCHRPGGFAPPDLQMDLRYDTSLADSNTCDEPMQLSTWAGIPRLAPGDPAGSGLVQRMEVDGVARMPLSGATRLDPRGSTLLREYISSLRRCP